MRRGLGPDSEYFIAFLPLALLIPLYFILRALLTGHWRRTRIKPLFDGRYAHLMQRKYWAFGFFDCLIQAITKGAWPSYTLDTAATSPRADLQAQIEGRMNSKSKL